MMKGVNRNLEFMETQTIEPGMGVYNYHHYLPHYEGLVGVICVVNHLKNRV